jgi:octaprenyl-diphosphate synthase
LSEHAATPETKQRLCELAVACELVHAATLLHDDVIDVGVERRGAPASRVLFGNTASILAGDHLLTEALRRVRWHGTPQLLDGLFDTISEMIAAEALQLEQQRRFEPRPQIYLRIVEGKTAALFRWGMVAGATMVSMPHHVVEQAGSFGRHLGIAFQLVDDLLDLDGDPAEVGKDTLADLRQGKLTWPLLIAARRDAAFASDLRRATAVPDGDDGGDALARDLVARVSSTGALAATRGAAAEHARHAQSVLVNLPAGPASRALQAVVDFCIRRGM